jgi:transaldolase
VADALEDLSAAGVSIWLDDLSRKLLATGALQRLVDHSHVVGITSNPTIFATPSAAAPTTTTRSETSPAVESTRRRCTASAVGFPSGGDR